MPFQYAVERGSDAMDDREAKLAEAKAAAAREAAERRAGASAPALPPEHHGRGGEEPTRYGDWEVKGLASDF